MLPKFVLYDGTIFFPRNLEIAGKSQNGGLKETHEIFQSLNCSSKSVFVFLPPYRNKKKLTPLFVTVLVTW